MKKRTRNKGRFRFLISLSLILSILSSSIPAMSLYSETNPFVGIGDVKVEENMQFDLLENISAFHPNGEELQVTISNVICETNEAYVYDSSNILTVGEAGSVYRVEYTAVSSAIPTEKYTASRRITSIKAENSIDESETNSPQSATEKNVLESEAELLNEDESFTLSEMDAMGYSVEMENSKIEIEYFDLECINEKSNGSTCTDLLFGDTQEIKCGRLKESVPNILKNSEDKRHSYIKAHVGNVQVYFIGKLHIEDGENTKDYIYYTTDKQITNKTVYAVLKKDEKITLSYSHDVDHVINYQFKDKDGKITEIGPNGWSYEEVFGKDRALTIEKDQQISNTIRIPRGYTATVTATDEKGYTLHTNEIGEMMRYKIHDQYKNQVVLTDKSPTSMILSDDFTIKNITSDITITVKYQKVDNFTFNARLWSKTAYANGRIKVNEQDPSDENCIIKTNDHSFSWEFDGITASDQSSGTGQGKYTWEMDQLEINGEAVTVPMTRLTDMAPRKEVTTLSTGTKATLTVQSLGGENANNGKRHYKLEIENCYEDLTVSGGNMVSHLHKEYAMNTLYGVKDAQYFAYVNMSGDNGRQWWDLEQDTLIGKKGSGENKYTDPIRFKRQVGFYAPNISFTTKEGEVLQYNEDIKGDSSTPYVEYLIRQDGGTDPKDEGSYKTVPFDEWVTSSDGYYYLRGTEALGTYMEQADDKGVILINIEAEPIKIALDYQNGAGKGKTAPLEKNIQNVPYKQLGGDKGYNIATNTKILVSNIIPVDKENEFIFDHWEVLATDRNDENPLGYLTDDVKKDENGQVLTAQPGHDYDLTVETLNRLDHCFYLDGEPKKENTHAVLTIRAVWKERGDVPSIPYTVRYVLADINNKTFSNERVIEEHTHTVNEGAMLATDLYQDGQKTLSENIQNILKGENKNHTDYTENGSCEWVVYEPKTTKQIPAVTINNNVATIYLIKGNTSIDVEKVWSIPEYKEENVTVQLQRKIDDTALWENVEKVSLSEKNSWKHTFNVPAYSDISNLKEYQYRVAELDKQGNIVEDNNSSVFGDNTYQVGYKEEPYGTWTITNTRLIDLTISKVVEGDLGDRTKKFTFDIKITDKNGTPLTGNYSYIGSIKDGYDQQSTKPEDGTITFKNGTGQIFLSHGQQITINNLPVNSKVSIVEQNADGYKTTYNGSATLTLTKLDQDTEIHVVNKKDTVPDTGIINRNAGKGILLAVGITGIFFLAYSVFRRRKGIK